MDKKTKGLLILGGGLILLFILLLLAGEKREAAAAEEAEAAEEQTSVVPDAERETITVSKMEAYEKDKGMSRTESYYNSCDDIYSSPAGQQQTQVQTMTTEQLLAMAMEEQQERARAQAVQESASYGNPYRETPQEREARHQRRREETIRMAGELAGTTDGTPDGDEEQEAYEDEMTDTTPVRIRPEAAVMRSNRISSLEFEDGLDSGGISSLDITDDFGEDSMMHPFKCMFAKDSKIQNGQRVSVILMEELIIDGALIPKNTHLMATCSISNRLEMNFMNIEMGGRILSLGFEAYDVDGSKGIYCPDVGNTGKQARSEGRNIINTRLTGLMGSLARDVVNTGVSLIQSKDGEVTVTVPAGYTFFIIKKKTNQ